ncbi:DNA polymerase beta superfamily protein [Microlunatus elymi]|nr:nucleotidyltransferase domain-containing protein [Microlunatus elymi]
MIDIPAAYPMHKHASQEARTIGEGPSGWIRFEQYERHSAWDRGGLRERSEAGDLDTLIYGARKWARLALEGNPTVLLPLFAPDDAVVLSTPAGDSLRGNGWRLASKQSVQCFLGYLRSQREAMTGSGPSAPTGPS